MRVELDIYSGRPNPRRDTSPAETAAIEAALNRLPVTETAVRKPFTGLGYRGFRVTDPARDRQIHVYHDVVVEQIGTEEVVRADPEATLERVLVAVVDTQLDASTREFLTRLSEYPYPSQ